MTDAPRKIVHLDADAFFASVEQALNPELRGKAIAVGGHERGIISSASYEARQEGVYTPMPSAQAKRVCPHLILVPGKYQFYEHFSRRMFEIIGDYTPDVEQCSIDEGYFDLSGRREPIEELARQIRERIEKTLRIPVSLGMGTNKLVTQIASKLNKPRSFTVVPPGSEGMFLYPLSNRWLPGVGEKTGRELDHLGLYKVFHLLEAPLELVARAVGSYAKELKQYAAGIDERPVEKVCWVPKSYGQQRTFLNDMDESGEVELALKGMVDHLMEKVRADHKLVRTVTLRIRYVGMEDVQGAESLREPTCLASEVYPLLRPLLGRIWKKPLKIRMAGVRLSNVYPFYCLSEKLPFFAEEVGSKEARSRLAAAVDALQQKLGKNSIGPARNMLSKNQKKD